MCTKLVCLLLYFQYIVVGVISEEGDICDLSTGEKGTCVNLQQCTYAINLLKNGVHPKVCGFIGLESLVCCKKEPEKLILKKHGEKSLQKCKEYYPYAIHGIVLAGAERSLAREFPHMAAIGFGDKDKIEWLCGGSIISMNFVLTAAHCLNSRDLGAARWVRLGELDFATDKDPAEPQDFTIIKRFSHPSYRPPARYHDIGLVQLDRAIKRTGFVNIACLDTVENHTEKIMFATGWGKTEFAGESSTHLLKTDLDVMPHEGCQKHYDNWLVDLPNGIQDDVHICAGGNEGHDTCQGDSGGPLQVRNFSAGSLPFVYNIVGVTSFGKACGLSKSPGIYTRVSSYLSWIEDTVWPS